MSVAGPFCADLSIVEDKPACLACNPHGEASVRERMIRFGDREEPMFDFIGTVVTAALMMLAVNALIAGMETT
jgi:hypothetical protein